MIGLTWRLFKLVVMARIGTWIWYWANLPIYFPFKTDFTEDQVLVLMVIFAVVVTTAISVWSYTNDLKDWAESAHRDREAFRQRLLKAEEQLKQRRRGWWS